MLIVKKRTILKNLAIFLCCGAAGWYLKGRLTPQVGGMAAMMGGGTPYVVTDKATIENVAPRKSYIGHVEAIKSVNLRPQITGYVEKVLFQEGSFVQEGDILFVIEQQRYMANLELSEAALAKAKANLLKVEKTINVRLPSTSKNLPQKRLWIPLKMSLSQLAPRFNKPRQTWIWQRLM